MKTNVQLEISTVEMENLLVDIIEEIVHDRVASMVEDLAHDRISQMVDKKVSDLHDSGKLDEMVARVIELNYGRGKSNE